jgi:hypothetical protein
MFNIQQLNPFFTSSHSLAFRSAAVDATVTYSARTASCASLGRLVGIRGWLGRIFNVL